MNHLLLIIMTNVEWNWNLCPYNTTENVTYYNSNIATNYWSIWLIMVKIENERGVMIVDGEPDIRSVLKLC